MTRARGRREEKGKFGKCSSCEKRVPIKYQTQSQNEMDQRPLAFQCNFRYHPSHPMLWRASLLDYLSHLFTFFFFSCPPPPRPSPTLPSQFRDSCGHQGNIHFSATHREPKAKAQSRGFTVKCHAIYREYFLLPSSSPPLSPSFDAVPRVKKCRQANFVERPPYFVNAHDTQVPVLHSKKSLRT